MSNIVQKLTQDIVNHPKYQKMVKAGYEPDYEIADDFTTIKIKPKVCGNGHPIFNETHTCLYPDCEGSKRIVYPDSGLASEGDK